MNDEDYRDLLTALAMQGLIVGNLYQKPSYRDNPKEIAAMAFEQADEMLRERNKNR
jgi:hypothetical protein